MNKEKLQHLFPEHFHIRKGKGYWFYALSFLSWIIAVFQISFGILSLVMPSGSGSLHFIFGAIFWGSLAWACFKVAQEVMNPFEKSKAIHNLLKAKAIIEQECSNAPLTLDPARVSVDYTDYSLLKLVDVYEHIDKEMYPENYHSLHVHLRTHVDQLNQHGIFSAE